MSPQEPNYNEEELATFFKKALKAQAEENYSEAEKYYQHILNHLPYHADSLHYLGLVKFKMGDNERAVSLIQTAISENNIDPEMYMNLGIILTKINKLDEAAVAYNKVLELSPDHAMAHNNLGLVLKKLGKSKIAIQHIRLAYQLNPNLTPILSSYANLLIQEFKYIEANKILNRALEIEPDNELILSSLGVNYYAIGDDLKGDETFSNIAIAPPIDLRAIELKIFHLNYETNIKPSDIFVAHKQYAALLSQQKAINIDKKITCNSFNKKIRIGYVSADFHTHSVSYFFLPIIKNHSKDKFEIFCYYNGLEVDHVSDIIQSNAFVWRSINNKSDDEVIQIIQQDNIDILVDLSGLTANNKLGVFANRASPVQMTYLGYPNTTGLDTMDYRLTDDTCDPAGQTDHLYSEKLLRLPECFLCYEPGDKSPEISQPPCLTNGYITFASFNNMGKQNHKVISLWCEVLKHVPESKLLLKAKSLRDDDVKSYTLERFAKLGIPQHRILLENYANNFMEHITQYNKVDIALDPFPYTGTTTTCEALWMGVPVVTLAGQTHRERVSTSLLNTVGLKETIASNEQEYLDICKRLSSNTELLKEMRSGLREKMRKSPLLDAPRFIQSLEAEYEKVYNKSAEMKQP